MSKNTSGSNAQVRAALEEMHLYLSDSIPPLFFADSVRLLMSAPPELVAPQVIAWANNQINPGDQLPTADYIFHAAKKLHMLAELELLPADAVKPWIAELAPVLVDGCPPEDRASLQADLSRLDLNIVSGPTAGVEVVYRRSGDGATRSSAAAGRAARVRGSESGRGEDASRIEEGLRRIDALLRRFQIDEAVSGAGSDVAAEIVTRTMEGARDSSELEHYFAELQKRGLSATPQNLVGLLAQRLPDWAAPESSEGESATSPQAAVRAMHRFISLADNREEGQRRFDDLVSTAVDEFNNGLLGRAVTLLDLAEQMMRKKEIDGVLAQSVERRAFKSISQDLLREIVDEEENPHLLRRFLGFFSELSPSRLLEDLEQEEDRDKRRYLLRLLRIHGEAARKVAFAELEQAASGESSSPWYYLRNLVHILRTIPRSETADIGEEIDLLVEMSSLDREYPLVREAVSALAQLHHSRAVTVLAARVDEIEQTLLAQEERIADRDQLYFLLDSTIKSLARMDLADARRCVVAHGLKRKPQLGDTLERLTWIEGQDLSAEADTVDQLVQGLRKELPKKVFGVSIMKGKKAQAIECLLRALSGTDTAAVRALLAELARESPDQPWAATAADMLAVFQGKGVSGAERGESDATLSGDLALFGLPNLLQNLADSQIAGALRVFDEQGATVAELWLDDGKVVGSRAGQLFGANAVYQLLEDPSAGRFVLDRPEMPPESCRTGPDPMSIQSILFEGIRRYDEFKRAASLVPDDARYRSTGKKPTMGEEEIDPEVLREIWKRASAGMPPIEAESEVLVDRYRVRSLYEHWIADGVLEPITTDPGSVESGA